MLGAVLLFVMLFFAALFVGRYAGARRRFVSRYAAVILLFVAAILTVIRGQTLLGAILGIGAAALYLFTDRPRPRVVRGNRNGRTDERRNDPRNDQRGENRQSGNSSVNGGAMSDLQARAILGVPQGATETEIRAAFRRRIQSAHPDHGGSNEEAARLSVARDVLLRR